MSENEVIVKAIGELLGMHFYIPSYQRGYRWTAQQINDLLGDVATFGQQCQRGEGEAGFYCLQPLVVKPMGEEEKKEKGLASEIEWYEVIDGQQRLTTLYLVLRQLRDVRSILGLSTEDYELRYAREKESLGSIMDALDDSQIDHYYLSQARDAIDRWFRKEEKANRGDFCNTLLKVDMQDGKDKAKNVRFIWYQVEEEVARPVEVFTRLNIGRIPLTNAELVKALVLHRKNFGTCGGDELHLRQQEIASEWDRVEYTLQRDDFWAFLHSGDYKQPTRIDWIFDMICSSNSLGINKDIGTDDYRTFRYFYAYFSEGDSRGEKLARCWEKVMDYFHAFSEWYDDVKLYHYVGFLVACGRDKRKDLIKIEDLIRKWTSGKTNREDFASYLKDLVGEKAKASLDEGNKSREKRDYNTLLLFHNIQTIINQNTNLKSNAKYQEGVWSKFPFHLYQIEKWDVEHINPATTNQEDDDATQKEWLINVYLALDRDKQKKVEQYFQENDKSKKDTIYEEIQHYVHSDALVKEGEIPSDGWSDEEKNSLWNYCLLDSSTNRSYGNAIFSAKRRIIIGKDRGLLIAPPTVKDGKLMPQGEKGRTTSAFVPPCTKQVFMKYYSPVLGDSNYWTKEDAKCYLDDIYGCLEIEEAE